MHKLLCEESKSSRKWKLGLTGTAIVAVSLACLESAIAEGNSEPTVSVQADSVEVSAIEAEVPDAAVPDQLKLVELLADSSPALTASNQTDPVAIDPVAAEMNSGEPPEPSVVESVAPARALNIDLYGALDDSDPMAQITNVSQLREVSPGDWAYEALRSLVERYGCIVGYPDQTFRGNRALTRWEFAAGLNACMEQMERLIAKSEAVLREDIEKLQRLAQEYEAELATQGARVDNLEGRVAFLEDRQFSTTTRLNGTTTISGLGYASGQGQREAVLQYSSFLQLATSFTGRDLFSTGLISTTSTLPELASSNNGRNVGFTNEGFSIWAYGGDTDSDLLVGTLEYVFPLSDNGVDRWYLTIAASDGFNTSRYLLPSGTLTWEGFELGSGPISAFGQRNPIYRLGGGTGLIINYVRGSWEFTTAYLVPTLQGASPSPGAGLFNGDNLILTQFNYSDDRFSIAAVYFHNFFGSGRFAFNNQFKFGSNFGADFPGYVGTALANRFDNADVFFEEDVSVSSNTYGLQTFYQISPNLVLGGFAANFKARLIGRGDADIWTYGVSLALPDLGKEGNLGGLIVGVEPTLTGLSAVGVSPKDFKRDTSLHIEAFYRHQVTDNLSITPGVMWITAPNQDADNEDIFLGLVRTTFSF